MRDLTIVMLMAGRGSRFLKAGFSTPKPLIPVNGEPMMLKALKSVDGIRASKKHIVVIREEHDAQYDLRSQLTSTLPDLTVIGTSDEPVGATRDAYRMLAHADPDSGLIVLDCDLWFNSPEYNQMVESSLNDEVDFAGGLLTFTADSPRYSYAQVDEVGRVLRTAEKVVISNRAITGAYYFRNVATFAEAADELLARPLGPELPEYYLSPLYNILLDRGDIVRAARVQDFASFGTPEELEAYEAGTA